MQNPLKQSLHPEFLLHVDALKELIDWASSERPEPEDLAEAIKANPDWYASYTWAMSHLAQSRIDGLAGCVYSVPFLSPEFCGNLISQSEVLAVNGGWRTNDCEPKPYQIPEIVIRKRDPALHELLEGLIPFLNLWFALVYQAVPQSVSSIQFTKYSPADIAGGNWHHDLDSDFTAVVSLAPSMYEGGGTDVRVTPIHYVRVPPLKPGYAMIFNGKQILHRGCPVTSGSRYLLTYWLDSARRQP